jgi:hypothetical protein
VRRSGSWLNSIALGCSLVHDEEAGRRIQAARDWSQTLMAFEEIKARISLLLAEMENRPEDSHELYLQLREKMNEMRAMGYEIPSDLIQLETRLEAEFTGKATPPTL